MRFIKYFSNSSFQRWMNDVKFHMSGFLQLRRKADTVLEMLIFVKQLKCEVFTDGQIL
jgi:hypothetical protein